MQINYRVETVVAERPGPAPLAEVEKILHLLQSFYEAANLGARDELITEFRKIQSASGSQVEYFSEMLERAERELQTGLRESFEESTGLQMQLIIVYCSLANCAEAMRSDLTRDQQWHAVCWAHNYLGRLRGTVSGEVTGTMSSIMARSRKALDGRHKENRDMKNEVFEWLNENMQQFSSLDSAAEAIAGGVAPIKFRTARHWVGQWKKTQSTGEK